jgi:hypothetical protein
MAQERARVSGVRRRNALAGIGAAALLALASCDEFGSGPRTVTRSGYRAVLAYSPKERYEVAVRQEKERVSGTLDGSKLVRVLRPDLGKIWQYRPTTKKLYETAWTPRDELVPGYPLGPGFDPEAYADRFRGRIRRIDDEAHGMHPCERYEMTLPSSDRAVIWVARDLERLVVRIEHLKKNPNDEYQAATDTQLLDVRLGAPADLFEKPKGFTVVKNYEELGR